MARKEVWTVCPRGEGKKDWWLRIGTAFANKDGSWTVMLDALPTNGKLIIRDEQERDRSDEPPRRAPQRSREDDDVPF